MPSASLTSERVLTLLAETPTRLAALAADLAPARLRTAPDPDAWSANEVLAHLRACADVWGGCIAAILAEDRPTLRGMDPRKWMKQTDYLDLEFQSSLRTFTRQRAELLAVLELLPREGWARTATVLAWGQSYERTVLDYLQRLARHERPHVKQIERLVKGSMSKGGK